MHADVVLAEQRLTVLINDASVVLAALAKDVAARFSQNVWERHRLDVIDYSRDYSVTSLVSAAKRHTCMQVYGKHRKTNVNERKGDALKSIIFVFWKIQVFVNTRQNLVICTYARDVPWLLYLCLCKRPRHDPDCPR